MIRIVLPFHLRNLARVDGEVTVRVADRPTLAAALDALESAHPVLRGTVREHGTGKRRPLIRFFACGQDLTHEPADTPLPDAVAGGVEPLIILSAIAGG